MAIKIITDSTSDLSQEFLDKNGVDVVRLKYYFGQDEYIDGVSMTNSEFYDKLRHSDILPTTSQPNPEAFVEVFEKHIANGDEIIGIFLAGELSGTIQSAKIAKDILGTDKIHLIDSRTVTFGLGAVVLEAVKLRDLGLSCTEILSKLDSFIEKNILYAAVGTLKYLQMGGRLSKTSAVVGSLLNMKPIVAVEEGKVVSVGKARGQHNSFLKMLDLIKENPINYDYPVILGHSDANELCDELKEFLLENGVNLDNSVRSYLGLVVGVHSGPGAVGLSYVRK